MKNCSATSLWARCSALSECRRVPVNRQITIADATPSMNEASPQPTSAIEPATTPCQTPTPPSIPM